jgi:glycosyltransferase involved in cell wall biosynthesis
MMILTQIQRLLFKEWFQIYNKIKYNKILLWIHDLTEKNVFLFNYDEEERKLYNNNKLYIINILKIFYNNKNINYIFVSNFIRDKFKNYITYVSAWQKGIEHVVNVFEHVRKYDNELKLVLLTHGYEWHNFKDYAEELKKKYSDNIIIYGLVNKNQYSKIIKESMVVLTTIFQETFGCVFAESYYLGTLVIADYKSGVVKVIIDNNYIVDFDNKKKQQKNIIYKK